MIVFGSLAGKLVGRDRLAVYWHEA